MTIGMVVGLILLPFAWALFAAASKAHRTETGADAPTRNAMRNIRRDARRKGISEEQAHREWPQRPATPAPSIDTPAAAARRVFLFYSSAATEGSTPDRSRACAR